MIKHPSSKVKGIQALNKEPFRQGSFFHSLQSPTIYGSMDRSGFIELSKID
jgi:hypothetical protein